MSTRSLICQIKNDKITFSHCSYDGFLSGVGETLLKHYSTAEKVEKLIDFGNFDELKEIENIISLKEPKNPVYTFPMFLERIKKIILLDYVYLFENGTWKVINFWDVRKEILMIDDWQAFLDLFSDLRMAIRQENE